MASAVVYIVIWMCHKADDIVFPQSLPSFGWAVLFNATRCVCVCLRICVCMRLYGYGEYVEDAAHILWEWAVIYAHIIPSPVQVTFQITSVCSMILIYCCHLFIIMMILWHCTGSGTRCTVLWENNHLCTFGLTFLVFWTPCFMLELKIFRFCLWLSVWHSAEMIFRTAPFFSLPRVDRCLFYSQHISIFGYPIYSKEIHDFQTKEQY